MVSIPTTIHPGQDLYFVDLSSSDQFDHLIRTISIIRVSTSLASVVPVAVASELPVAYEELGRSTPNCSTLSVRIEPELRALWLFYLG